MADTPSFAWDPVKDRIKHERIKRGEPPKYRQRLHVRTAGYADAERASEHALAEREARQEASYRRSIGAELMGDPPPGWSALDKR